MVDWAVSRQVSKSLNVSVLPGVSSCRPQVYHLAGVRLRELCDQLQVSDEDLRSKMWTCFEHALTQCSDLMGDRHLDQLLMCAVYIMAKVTGRPLNFQDIMKCYRFQPQAQSHVSRLPLSLSCLPLSLIVSPCR